MAARNSFYSPGPLSKKVTFVCTSDTHCRIHDITSIPKGDVLLHAGDFSMRGTALEVKQFNDLLGRLPHSYKVVIAGNHEASLYSDYSQGAKTNTEEVLERFGVVRHRDLFTNAIYLEDESVELYGLKIYGSPWSPSWGRNCCAFQKLSGPQLKAKWMKIPEDVDILMTHSPPFGYCDTTWSGENAGCQDLLQVVQRIKPKFHVFGHIHEGYGKLSTESTTFINASMCTKKYAPINTPIVFEIDGRT